MSSPAIASLLLAATLGAGEVLADLDLGGAAVPALLCTGVTWTPDGLFLPAATPFRVPRAYPVEGLDFAAPRAPYRADLALPALSGRAVTVTLQFCLAGGGRDQDNLFSLGRRSRWLSAQVGSDGRVVVGRDNRWTLYPAAGLPAVADQRWHVLSVAVGEGGGVLAAVDGVTAELPAPRDPSRYPPRALPDDEAVLSFADPGSARHLHGLVRRVVVQRGRLDAAALVALQRGLAVPAAPLAPVFVQARGSTPPSMPEAGPEAAPAGVSDF